MFLKVDGIDGQMDAAGPGLIPIRSDWDGDGRDSIGDTNGYVGSHSLYQDMAMPLGDSSVRLADTSFAWNPGDVDVTPQSSTGYAILANEFIKSMSASDGNLATNSEPRSILPEPGDEVLVGFDNSEVAHFPDEDTGARPGHGEGPVLLWESLPGAHAGQPITFTATVHTLGYAGGVFVASGDIDGSGHADFLYADDAPSAGDTTQSGELVLTSIDKASPSFFDADWLLL
jgi:hypothetical protein